MVWGAITYYGTIELQFYSSKMNGIRYKEALQEAFPTMSNFFGNLD